MSLIRLQSPDLPVGVPLPWAIYGKNGGMLLSAGGVIASDDAAELLKLGLFRHRDSSDAARNDRDITQRRNGGKPEIPGFSINVESMQIGVREEGNKERSAFRVEFLGLIPETSLIVSHPQREGKLVPMGGGQTATAKMFVNRYVHAFVSQIMVVQKHPVPHLHLSYPDEIKSSMFRSSRRILLQHRILALLQMGEDVAIPVAIADMSNRGLGVFSEYDLGETGASVRLSFSVTCLERSVPIRAVGIIRSARAVKAQKGFQYGIELVDMNADQRSAIESFIYEQL